MSDSLLATTLQVAVPMHVDDIIRQGLSFEQMRTLAQESAQIVAEKGDIILYRSTKKGETAAAFNALARGIAILSFQVGGVLAFGSRYTTIDGKLTIGGKDR